MPNFHFINPICFLSVTDKPLDVDLLVGFFSSVSTFTQGLVNQGLKKVCMETTKFLYLDAGNVLFVSHCDIDDSDRVIESSMKGFLDLCVLFFGPANKWDEGFLALDGFSDILDAHFERCMNDPASLVDGIEQILFDSHSKDKLDMLLNAIEDCELVSNNGSMLVLNDKVIHSRFPTQETACLLNYIRARSMGSLTVKYSSIFLKNHWCSLYFIRVESAILVIQADVKAQFKDLVPIIQSFEVSLHDSSVHIPSEEPMVLLRHFATRDTLAFIYYNTRSCITVSPEFRQAPDTEKKLLLKAFWWLFSEVAPLIKRHGISSVTMSRDAYRLHAFEDGIHNLYVLFSEDVPLESIETLSHDILRKVQARYS
eukprot:Nk52_evm44s236 gene=Nk52_evmTU44s236